MYNDSMPSASCLGRPTARSQWIVCSLNICKTAGAVGQPLSISHQVGLPLNQLKVVYCTHVRFIINDLQTLGWSNLENATCEPECAIPQNGTCRRTTYSESRETAQTLIYDWPLYINRSESMKLFQLIALMVFAAASAGCGRSTVSKTAGAGLAESDASLKVESFFDLKTEYKDLLSPPLLTEKYFPTLRSNFQFEVVNVTNATSQDPHSILTMLRGAKATGKDFSAISSIEFTSPTNALVWFLWSGGFHSGSFSLEKNASTWKIISEKYYF